jgi:hypothetical protein
MVAAVLEIVAAGPGGAGNAQERGACGADALSAARFTNSPAYFEVDAEHNLTLPENPAWPSIEAAAI